MTDAISAARLLVVDDEQMIVHLLSQVLTRMGYEVFAETQPRKAIDLVSGGQSVDLVISDVVMPEMSGPEVISEVGRISPSTKAILMSGFTVPKELPPSVPFLQKPFTPTALLSTVERVLQSLPG